ncbi:60S acidic ribosomal protein P1 [Puttea exsequens]|nr:60S acidic ribosomal protein P1 [Puttea exsequens]
MSQSELAVSYASLILADDDVDVTPEKLQTLIKAANVEDVESIWTTLFAKALEGKNVKDMLLNVGSGGGSAAAPTGGAGAGGAAPDLAQEEETKPEKEEEKEESDEDMGFGLFD